MTNEQKPPADEVGSSEGLGLEPQRAKVGDAPLCAQMQELQARAAKLRPIDLQDAELDAADPYTRLFLLAEYWQKRARETYDPVARHLAAGAADRWRDEAMALRVQVRQADERGDEAMRRAHTAEAALDDVATMTRRLVTALRKARPCYPQDLDFQALTLLRKHGLAGSPLREEPNDGGLTQCDMHEDESS